MKKITDEMIDKAADKITDEVMDVLLGHALAPAEEPDDRVNQQILERMEEGVVQERDGRRWGGRRWNGRRWNGRRQGGRMQSGKQRFSAVIAAAAVLCMCSITAYGAWRCLTPGQLAEHMGDAVLADAFLSEGALQIGEVQSYGGYDVTLLGIVSGEGLSEFRHFSDGELLADRSYAAVAISCSDGASMPDSSGDAYDGSEFFVSPLIGGYSPVNYNAATMHGSYGEAVVDGVLYRLVECDNVEVFADHDLYLCVSDSTFYPTKAYHYDSATGKIARNEEYAGLNALFELPIDASKANPQKAAQYAAALGVAEVEFSEEKLHPEPGCNAGAVIEESETGVVAYALQFVGNPYKWGGDSLTEGTDCSGFTKSVYAQFGVSLPHSAAEQRKQGVEVDGLENAQAGDLLFYEEPLHVALYIGNGWIVHAFPDEGICVSEADYDVLEAIRRVAEPE